MHWFKQLHVTTGDRLDTPQCAHVCVWVYILHTYDIIHVSLSLAESLHVYKKY